MLIEYFIGTEILRLVILITIDHRRCSVSLRDRLGFILRHELPYAAMLACFLVWRFLFFTGDRTATDITLLSEKYQSNGLGLLLRIPFLAIRDFLQVSVSAWFAPFTKTFGAASPAMVAVSVFLGLVVLGSFLVFQKSLTSNLNDDMRAPSSRQGLWITESIMIGALGTLFALLPVIMAKREVHLLDLYDRYTVPALIPVCLLVVGIIFRVVRPNYRSVFLGLLIAFSVITHLNNGNIYRVRWQEFTNLWWQLSWRAPALKAGTLLVVNPLDEEADRIWAPANFVYGNTQPELFVYGAVLGPEIYPMLLQQKVVEQVTRSVVAQADFSKTLLVLRPNAVSCLRVLDGNRNEFPPQGDKSMLGFLPLSKINQILSKDEALLPSSIIFGPEPEHTWCFFFQKAELARQNSQWPLVIELLHEAQQRGYNPVDLTEWLPFFEATIRSGDMEQYNAIVMNLGDVSKQNLAVKVTYCRFIKQLSFDKTIVGKSRNMVDSFSEVYNCTQVK